MNSHSSETGQTAGLYDLFGLDLKVYINQTETGNSWHNWPNCLKPAYLAAADATAKQWDTVKKKKGGGGGSILNADKLLFSRRIDETSCKLMFH